jgi:Photosynthesis system II assembly factor YCF48/Putative zinc-finger
MEALPKIVRQRLQSRAKSGVHPHADLLTAFSEKTLTERERTRVVEHLSRCEDCREVMFLAPPQQMPAQAGERISVSSGWLSWPVLRWSAAVACVVIVGTAVTLRQQSQNPPVLRDSEQSRSEKTQTPAPKTAPLETTKKTTPNSVPIGEVKDKDDEDKVVRSQDADKLSAKAEPAPRPNRNAMTAIPRVPMQFDQSRQINGNETGANGAVSAGVALDENRPAASAPAMMARGANLADQSESAKKQAPTSSYTVNVAAASEPVTVQSANTPVAQGKDSSDAALQISGRNMQPTGSSAVAGALMKAGIPGIAPRWMLTPGGILQRSLDQGKTWKTIPVADKRTFQSFAAIAADVWVGGANGLLYHSSDGGLHWIQVTPQANGESLTSGVISIEFSDAPNGKVTTADGETWTTSDAGKSWQKN